MFAGPSVRPPRTWEILLLTNFWVFSGIFGCSRIFSGILVHSRELSCTLGYYRVFSDILMYFGYFWVFCGIFGYSRIFSDILGYFRVFLVIYGYFWTFSGTFGYSRAFSGILDFWVFCGIFGYFRIFSDILGYSRAFLGIFRYFRVFSCIFGYFRAFSGIFGFSRVLSCMECAGMFWFVYVCTVCFFLWAKPLLFLNQPCALWKDGGLCLWHIFVWNPSLSPRYRFLQTIYFYVSLCVFYRSLKLPVKTRSDSDVQVTPKKPKEEQPRVKLAKMSTRPTMNAIRK